MNGHWRAFSPQNISCPTHTTYIPIHFFTFTVKPDILGPSNEIITLLFTVKPDILGAWQPNFFTPQGQTSPKFYRETGHTCEPLA